MPAIIPANLHYTLKCRHVGKLAYLAACRIVSFDVQWIKLKPKNYSNLLFNGIHASGIAFAFNRAAIKRNYINLYVIGFGTFVMSTILHFVF